VILELYDSEPLPVQAQSFIFCMEWAQEVGCGYVDWTGLAQDRDRWWTLVSAVMNILVP